MPVDPQIQTLLDLRAALPPLHTLSVADARAQFAARDVPGLAKAGDRAAWSTATCRGRPARWGCASTRRWATGRSR